jgi:hypothetical protein
MEYSLRQGVGKKYGRYGISIEATKNTFGEVEEISVNSGKHSTSTLAFHTEI